MKKFLITSLIIVFLGLMVRHTYYVVNISSVHPPIKIYQFDGTKEMFQRVLNGKKINFKIQDVVGNAENGFATYFDITTDNFLYTVKFKECNKRKKKNSEVQLVFAYDSIHNFGGYTNEAKNMSMLIQAFESRILEIGK